MREEELIALVAPKTLCKEGDYGDGGDAAASAKPVAWS